MLSLMVLILVQALTEQHLEINDRMRECLERHGLTQNDISFMGDKIFAHRPPLFHSMPMIQMIILIALKTNAEQVWSGQMAESQRIGRQLLTRIA